LLRSFPVLKQIIMRVIAGVLSGVLSFVILAMLGVVTLA
jgi:hypothetical protein